MVLKGLKREIRSGNTFRTVCPRADVQKHPQAVIVRTSHCVPLHQADDEADDSHLTTNAVAFSLNKKGRWNLPGLIQERLSSEDFETNSCGLVISMLEHHRVKRQSDCVSVITNHSAIRDRCSVNEVPLRKKARRKMYCNGLNILNNGRGRNTKETRKKRVISSKKDIDKHKAVDPTACKSEDTGENNAEDEVACTICYDVYYPLPSNSSLRFQPKFCSDHGSNDGNEGHLRQTPGLKFTKGSKQRHKHFDLKDNATCYDWSQEEDDIYDEDDEFFEDDHQEDDLYDEDNEFFEGDTKVSQCFTSFSDILETVLLSASSNVLANDVTDRAKVSTSKRSKSQRGSRTIENRYSYKTERESHEEYLESDVDSCAADTTSSSSSSETDWVVLPNPTAHVLPFNMVYKTVRLPKSAASIPALKHLYGAKYVEGDCLPRRFIVDITDDVSNTVRNSQQCRHLYLPILDLSACVVFVLDGSSDSFQDTGHDGSSDSCQDIVHEPIDVYRVALNMNLSAETEVCTLTEMMVYKNLADIIQCVREFVAGLSPDMLVRRDPAEALPCVQEQRTGTDFQTVSMVNRWRISLLHLPTLASRRGFSAAGATAGREDKLAFECPIESPGQTVIPSMAEDVAREGFRDEAEHDGKDSGASVDVSPFSAYCTICYDEVTPRTGGAPATALTSCGHWFCDGCWRVHLTYAARDVSVGAGLHPRCPEFGCQATVDDGTLLSLLNVAEAQRLKRQRLELEVMKSAPTKWCPNPQCGRLICLESTDARALSTASREPKSLMCTCGTQLCFTCLRGAHWPASCQEHEDYLALLDPRDRMIQTKEPDVADVMVYGKKCPNCHTFFEKNGGCNHMTCRCGHEFCWFCRENFYLRNGQIHACIRRPCDVQVIMKKIRHRERPEPKVVSRWCAFALRHRNAQLSRQSRRTHKMADDLRLRLQDLASKGVDIGVLAYVLDAGKVSRGGGNVETGVANQIKHPPGMAVAPVNGCRSRCEMSTQELHGYIDHVTQVMTKLKIELHHVLEYAGVALSAREETINVGNSNKTTVSLPSRLEEIIERTENVISALDCLIQTSCPRDLRKVLQWFRRLHLEAIDCMDNLKRVLYGTE